MTEANAWQNHRKIYFPFLLFRRGRRQQREKRLLYASSFDNSDVMTLDVERNVSENLCYLNEIVAEILSLAYSAAIKNYFSIVRFPLLASFLGIGEG